MGNSQKFIFGLLLVISIGIGVLGFAIQDALLIKLSALSVFIGIGIINIYLYSIEIVKDVKRYRSAKKKRFVAVRDVEQNTATVAMTGKSCIMNHEEPPIVQLGDEQFVPSTDYEYNYIWELQLPCNLQR